MTFYDQLDQKGALVKSAIQLTPYSFLPDGHSWIPHVVTAAEIAAKEAFAAQESADNAAKQSAKADSVIQYLVGHTPVECDAYVKANVTNLTTAVSILGKVAMALSVLARSDLR
jgi:hypothetical protein